MKSCISCGWTHLNSLKVVAPHLAGIRSGTKNLAARFLVSMIFFALFSAQAATWYVDNTATGSHNGTSWANAWTSLSQISGVSAGDTVYLSGGPSGSSQTYSVSSWKPTGGTASARITYQIGQDSAHNGTVIFSGTGTWFGGANNVVVSGNAGDGAMHFVCSGYTMAASINSDSNLRISYVNLGNTLSAGIEGQGISNFMLDNCYAYISSPSADHFMSCGVNGTTWDNGAIIATNTIYCPHLSSNANGADFFQLDGTGFSLYGNAIIGYSMSYTGGQHQDGWQGVGPDTYIQFAGNVFLNIENFSLFADAYYGGFNHVRAYNNIFINSVGTCFGTDGGYNGSLPCTYNDVVIANNLMDYSDSTSAPWALNNVTSFATTFTSCIVANNTVINGQNISTQGDTTATVLNTVVLTRTQAASDFTKYSALTTNSDFHLLAAATALIGKGTNMSAYFTTDRDGNFRAATGNWDIGPYAYSTNAPAPTPIIQVNPGSLGYGTVLVGTKATNSLTVKNIGTGSLSGTATAGSPFSIVSGSSYSLAAGQTQSVVVVFSPVAASNYTQNVSLTGGGGTNVTVSGSATNAPVPTPIIQVSPGSIGFGTILAGTSATNSFTVKNNGTGTLSGTASVASPFSMVSGSSYSLGAGQTQLVMVAFSPLVASNYNQSVNFTGGGGTNVAVSGGATNAPVPTPIIQVNPGSIGYGTLLAGTSATNSFTVKNNGTGTLSGTASVASPFSILSGGNYNLSAGQAQLVMVVFSPLVASNYNQSVNFSGGGGTNVTVSGSATNAPVPTPIIQVSPGSIGYGTVLVGTSTTNSFTVKNNGTGTLSGTAGVASPFSIVSGGNYSLGAGQTQLVMVAFSPLLASNYNQNVSFSGGGGTNVTVSGSATNAPVPTPVIQVSPGSIGFGTVLVGVSVTNSFTVLNIGAGTLSGTASAASPFSIVSGSSYTLGAGQTQMVVVAFSPLVASNYNQSVNFTGGGGMSVTVSGSATNAPVPAPILQVSPGSMGYGTVLVGTSVTNGFTVKNMGTGTLSGAASAASPFSIVSGGNYNLSAGQTQLVWVAFSPLVASNYNRTVSFSGGSGTNVTVSGSATNAPVAPTVSAISVNATDVDLTLPGLQIYSGSTVQLSATAANAQTWQWSYTVNGGSPVVYTNSTSPITNISAYFGANTIGNSYVWTLVVSNGSMWAQSQTNFTVEALPNSGGTGTNGEIIINATSVPVSGMLTTSTTIGGTPVSYIYQPLPSMGTSSGGTAVYNFTLTNAGNYEVQALVNAPSLNANSFYVNIDGQPQNPTMIWDIMPITSGFEQRIVSWRGSGSENNDQIVPKIFNLSAGPHQIVFVGREPYTALSSFALVPVASTQSTLSHSTSVQPPTTPDNLHVVSP